MKILLSIKPEYVEKIFNGEKKYEFRKVLFKNQEVEKVIVYSTMPVGKIVGEFEIDEVIKERPHKLWKITKKYSGVERSFYDAYYNGKEYAIAIKIKSTVLYDQPINPKEVFERFTAPQSFMYIDQEKAHQMEAASIC